MATVGIVGGRQVGDPFEGRPRRGFAAGVIAAVFRNTISRNREPANRAPVAPPVWHGSTFPFQDFGFHSQPARVNRPDLLAASRRNVPLAPNAIRKAAN